MSFANLKGAPAPVLNALPPAFPEGQRGGTTGTPQAVTVRNRGDAPLTIGAVQVQASAPDAAAASDFAITGQTCTSAPLAPGASCTVSVAFKPTRALTTSLARLQFTSNADDATESVMLLAKSANALDVPVPVGGEVPGILSLQLGGRGELGTFLPGTARDYTSTLAGTVTTTTPDAALTVVDPSATLTGHLVNGTRGLAQPLQVRGGTGVYAPLTVPQTLASWPGPVTSESIAVGFKQSIGAADTLLRGSYAKTLTFTLSSTTP